ncbi:DUF4044 domain-containing protein [Bombilactobacillus thymidiniphilus]|uniref:DUF4044 domain-containing protein n=1 Tax=Bombilactobacillus thymidiniphilus TaxID=2923363 RepID=A0ABY4PDP6_9LACO|nr:DUF4044 domain-containing protein [Bombilactobacillus thymidiniphilus]UQS83798.1 DUF4044 domain-containing protein [Bombilactobacillus thymidiniphilus]
MKKKKSTFARITQFFIWFMLIVIVAGVIFQAVVSFM